MIGPPLYKYLAFICICFFTPPHLASCANVFVNFDDVPVTSTGGAPSSSPGWIYGSNHTSGESPEMSAGWYSTTAYVGDAALHNYVSYYVNGYNTTHMGFSTYGYLEIDGSNYVKGNSLKITTTGGVTTLDNDLTTTTYGSAVGSKEDYLDYIAASQDPIGATGKVGHPYIYFGNTDSIAPYEPFPEASGATRMSAYLYTPNGVNNGVGGYGASVEATTNFGPFNGNGEHWYHLVYNRGGGWTHVLLDSHPQHNNAWSNAAAYPYPSYSLRAIGSAYFSEMYRWYITFKPYTGISTPPYYTWIDEVEFLTDTEPQNDETIAGPAVTYYPSTKSFEIGFNDKYKNLAHSYSTYEVRYSFSQITNANWGSATPILVQADPRFSIQARSDGKFQKWWPYYQGVWAPFKLQATDEPALAPGTTVYFAIKDISNIDSSGDVTTTPVDGINGYWGVSKGGRAYAAYPASYDYAGDAAAMPYIKRIDYYIGGGVAPAKGKKYRVISID